MRAAEVRHANHVAVSVVDIALNRWTVFADGGAAQAIAGFERPAVRTALDQTRFTVSVVACPRRNTRTRPAMNHFEDVADLVVNIALAVAAHRVAVARLEAAAWTPD